MGNLGCDNLSPNEPGSVMDDVIPRADRIAATEDFIRNVGVNAAAEFIVDLQDSVAGLGRNNSALVKAFQEVLKFSVTKEQRDALGWS